MKTLLDFLFEPAIDDVPGFLLVLAALVLLFIAAYGEIQL